MNQIIIILLRFFNQRKKCLIKKSYNVKMELIDVKHILIKYMLIERLILKNNFITLINQ